MRERRRVFHLKGAKKPGCRKSGVIGKSIFFEEYKAVEEYVTSVLVVVAPLQTFSFFIIGVLS